MRARELLIMDTLEPCLGAVTTEKVLIFYVPKLNTPVCDTEIQTLQEYQEQFLDQKCAIIITSADTEYTFKRYWKQNALTLKYSSDVDGVRARGIGGWDYENQLPQRLVVMLERNKAEGYSFSPIAYLLYPFKVGRSVSELLRLLDGYNSGKLCPEASKCKQNAKKKGR